MMSIYKKELDNTTILYCEPFSEHEIMELFDHKTSKSSHAPELPGRGQVKHFEYHYQKLISRHYLRGGFFRHLLKDRYFYFSNKTTRAWREIYLLTYLNERKLPVPTPVACKIQRNGLVYKADLIMLEIPQAFPLSNYLQQHKLSENTWQQIGRVIKQFHHAGVYHADLNAHNILIDGEEKIWLIDFDRCCIKKNSSHWQLANLKRLRRSLLKLSRHQPFNFSSTHWDSLLSGYQN